MTVHTACDYVGLAHRSYYRWMEKGRESGLRPYRQFWQSVTRATTKSIGSLEKVVHGRATSKLELEDTHYEVRKDASGNVIGEVQRVKKRELAPDTRLAMDILRQRKRKQFNQRPYDPDAGDTVEGPEVGGGPPRKIEVVFAEMPTWKDGKLVSNQEGPVEEE